MMSGNFPFYCRYARIRVFRARCRSRLDEAVENSVSGHVQTHVTAYNSKAVSLVRRRVTWHTEATGSPGSVLNLSLKQQETLTLVTNGLQPPGHGHQRRIWDVLGSRSESGDPSRLHISTEKRDRTGFSERTRSPRRITNGRMVVPPLELRTKLLTAMGRWPGATDICLLAGC